MDRQAFKPKAQSIQTVAMSLMSGLVIVTGALVFLVSRRDGAQPPVADLGFPLWPIPMALAFLVFVLTDAIGSSVVSGGAKMVIQKRQRNGSSVQSIEKFTSGVNTAIFGIVTGRFLVIYALIEGVGLLGAAIYFLEGNHLALIVPAASVLRMALVFPTTDLLLSVYEAIERRIDEESKVDA